MCSRVSSTGYGPYGLIKLFCSQVLIMFTFSMLLINELWLFRLYYPLHREHVKPTPMSFYCISFYVQLNFFLITFVKCVCSSFITLQIVKFANDNKWDWWYLNVTLTIKCFDWFCKLVCNILVSNISYYATLKIKRFNLNKIYIKTN